MRCSYTGDNRRYRKAAVAAEKQPAATHADSFGTADGLFLQRSSRHQARDGNIHLKQMIAHGVVSSLCRPALRERKKVNILRRIARRHCWRVFGHARQARAKPQLFQQANDALPAVTDRAISSRIAARSLQRTQNKRQTRAGRRFTTAGGQHTRCHRGRNLTRLARASFAAGFFHTYRRSIATQDPARAIPARGTRRTGCTPLVPCSASRAKLGCLASDCRASWPLCGGDLPAAARGCFPYAASFPAGHPTVFRVSRYPVPPDARCFPLNRAK